MQKISPARRFKILSDRIEVLVKIIGIIGALIAAYVGLTEMRENRIQRQMDLRWKQASAAKQLVDQMQADVQANSATLMIDWTGWPYKINDSDVARITYEDVSRALRTEAPEGYTNTEKYIRDCFDSFLFYTEFMEQSLENNLFEFSDIKFPMKYYADVIVQNGMHEAVDSFITVYQYENSAKFFRRFESWK